MDASASRPFWQPLEVVRRPRKSDGCSHSSVVALFPFAYSKDWQVLVALTDCSSDIHDEHLQRLISLFRDRKV